MITLTVQCEGFESKLEVPDNCTKKQFDEFAKQWLKMMHTALHVAQNKEVKDELHGSSGRDLSP